MWRAPGGQCGGRGREVGERGGWDRGKKERKKDREEDEGEGGKREGGGREGGERERGKGEQGRLFQISKCPLLSPSPAGDQPLFTQHVTAILCDECLQLLTQDYRTEVWDHEGRSLALHHTL